MSARDFPLVSIRRADCGPRQAAHEIVCGVCRDKDHVVITGAQKVVPGTIVAKRFSTAGWLVGKRPDDDRCPACAGRRTPVPRPTETLPMVTLVPPSSPPGAVSTRRLSPASPPTKKLGAAMAALGRAEQDVLAAQSALMGHVQVLHGLARAKA